MSARIGKVKRPSVWEGKSVVTLIAALLSGAVSAVPVAADWELPITASVSTMQVYRDTATAAVQTGATDGFDGYSLDQPHAPAPPVGIRVYFPHSDWGQAETLFTRDAGQPLPACSSHTWEFTVESVGLAGNVGLTFGLSRLPDGYVVVLTDLATGQGYDPPAYPGFTATAGATRNFRLHVVTPCPDLTPQMTISPSGTQRTVTITVTNQGTGASSGCYTAFYGNRATTPTCGTTPYSYRWWTPALQPKTTATLTWTFAASLGSIKSWAYVDYLCSQTESVETNNVTSVDWSVRKPDLVVQSFSFTPASAAILTNTTVTCVVRNAGDLPAASSWTAIYGNRQTAPGAKTRPFSWLVWTKALESGKSVTLTETFIRGSAGYFKAWALADWQGTVDEDSETNNTASFDWAVPPPDLVVESLTITPPSANVVTPRTVTCVVKNIGGVATSFGFWTAFFGNSDTEPPALTVPYANLWWTNAGLAPGGTVTLTWPFTPTTPGAYKSWAVADWQETLKEADETNNAKYARWGMGGRDLTIESFTFDPLSAGLLTDTTVTCVVRNRGGEAVPSSWTAIYGNRQTAPGVQARPYSWLVWTKALEPGEPVTLTQTFKRGSIGSFKSWALADWQGTCSETDESNNTAYVNWQTVPADLVVQSLTVTSIGNTHTFTCVVKNEGESATIPSWTALYGNRSTAPVALARPYSYLWPTPALSPGQSTTLTWSFSGSVTGEIKSWALADWQGAIVELSETNNAKSVVWSRSRAVEGAVSELSLSLAQPWLAGLLGCVGGIVSDMLGKGEERQSLGSD